MRWTRCRPQSTFQGAEDDAGLAGNKTVGRAQHDARVDPRTVAGAATRAVIDGTVTSSSTVARGSPHTAFAIPPYGSASMFR
jgi:hypothetical protein